MSKLMASFLQNHQSTEDGSKEVLKLLQDLQLMEYYDTLMEQGYDDMRSIVCLQEDDLTKMGFKAAQSRRLLMAINDMKRTPKSRRVRNESNQSFGSTDEMVNEKVAAWISSTTDPTPEPFSSEFDTLIPILIAAGVIPPDSTNMEA
eukprot:GGOE01005267.1.p1 GENE.GGOE01005267.1~~GGOE01005267.1.p1  ORF type:complete len:147 (-),score=30.05 GGOE01005267.1:951-1391(-)